MKARLVLLRSLVAMALIVPAVAPASADGGRVIVVPPGNRATTQPQISNSSIVRTAETRSTFDAKFKAIYDSLSSQPQLIDKIVKTSAIYGVDPIHLVGAIVGEHTYNVDVMDSLQGYYIKAISYLNEGSLKFAYNGEPISDFLARPEFADCADGSSDYVVWSCRDRIWRTVFQGKTVGGKSFPNDRFTRVFFQPFFAGQTFGLGQMSPVSALSVSDLVHQKGGLPLLDANRAGSVYRAVMDPDLTLNYMAALISRDIDVYRDVAGFDISGNPGLTATLYNTGDAEARAEDLAAQNRKRRAAGQSPILPRENYYGWLINDRLDVLKKLLPGGDAAKSD